MGDSRNHIACLQRLSCQAEFGAQGAIAAAAPRALRSKSKSSNSWSRGRGRCCSRCCSRFVCFLCCRTLRCLLLLLLLFHRSSIPLRSTTRSRSPRARDLQHGFFVSEVQFAREAWFRPIQACAASRAISRHLAADDLRATRHTHNARMQGAKLLVEMLRIPRSVEREPQVKRPRKQRCGRRATIHLAGNLKRHGGSGQDAHAVAQVCGATGGQLAHVV